MKRRPLQFLFIPVMVIAIALAVSAAPAISAAVPEQTGSSAPETIVLGTSVNGQPIEAIRYGNGPDVLLFVGGVHGGYAPASVGINDGLAYALRQLGDELPANLTIYLIPTINPDVDYNPGQLTGRVNANGVDIAQNADCAWKSSASWEGGEVPGDGGSAPFSEPETAILRDFVLEQRPVATVIWDGSRGRGWVRPGSCGDRFTPSDTLAQTLARGGFAFQYEATNTANGAPLSGDFANWMAAEGLAAASVGLRGLFYYNWDRTLPALVDVINLYGGTELTLDAFTTDLDRESRLANMTGEWSGLLNFGGEGGDGQGFYEFELIPVCENGLPCLQNTSATDQFMRFVRFELVTEENSNFFIESRICFAEFVTFFEDDPPVPVTELCLEEFDRDTLAVVGSGTLIGIDGHLDRTPFNCVNVGGFPIEQCEALVSFYESTGGDGWTDNGGWLQSNDLCSWTGISCSASGISGISLTGNNLTGTLPASLGSLPLQQFSVSDNRLAGGLPTTLADPSMILLDVGNTDLSGPIPTSYSQMSQLSEFDFAGSEICIPGDPEIGRWLQSITNLFPSGLICPGEVNGLLVERLREQLDEKERLIDSLKNPSSYSVSQEPDDLLVQLALSVTSVWGFDERVAEEIIADLRPQLDRFAAGEMSQEEMVRFEAEAEAFGRLLLPERTAAALFPHLHGASEDIATTIVSSTAYGLSLMKSLEAPPVRGDVIKWDVEQNWRRRAYQKVNGNLNKIWDLLLNTIPDPDHREAAQTLRWGLFTYVDAKLDAEGTLGEILLETGVNITVSHLLTQIWINAYQEILIEAAEGVQAGAVPVTGPFNIADGYNAVLNNSIATESERVRSAYENFQDASKFLEITTDVGKLGKGSLPGATLYFASIGFNTSIQAYSGFRCGYAHHAYLKTSLERSVEAAFEAEGLKIEGLPEADHCRLFEGWGEHPGWPWNWGSGRNRASQFEGKPAGLASYRSQSGGTVTVLAEFDAALAGYRSTLQQVVDNLEGDQETLSPLLDTLYTQDVRLSAMLEGMTGSIEAEELGQPPIEALAAHATVLDGQMLGISFALLDYMADPNDPAVQAEFAGFAAELEETALLLDEALTTLEAIPEVVIDTALESPIILDVPLPLDAGVGEPLPLGIDLLPAETSDGPLTLHWTVLDADYQPLFEETSPFDGAEGVTYTPERPGRYQIYVEMLGESGAVIDSATTYLDVDGSGAEGAAAADATAADSSGIRFNLWLVLGLLTLLIGPGYVAAKRVIQ